MKRIRETKNDFSAIQTMVQPLIDERLAEIDELNAQPHEYSEESVERIGKIIGNPRKRFCPRKVSSLSRRVASAALISGTVLLTAALSIQPIRAEIWEIFLEWHEEYFTVQFSEEFEQECPQTIENRILPDNLPEGWRIQTEGESFAAGVYQIFGTNDEWIFYMQNVVGGSTSYDNTDVVMETIRLNNDTAAYMMTYAEGDIAIYWADVYEFSLMGRNISREQLIAFAENIDSQNH